MCLTLPSSLETAQVHRARKHHQAAGVLNGELRGLQMEYWGMINLGEAAINFAHFGRGIKTYL